MQTFKAMVKDNKGFYRDTTIQAKSVFDAKSLLETQYGKGNVTGVVELK